MFSSASIPSHAQILVVGGGPAGSYAATTLAREGFDVVLLEASKFPRYHIGESLIPSVRHYLKFIDAEEKIANHGFEIKPGAAIKLNQHKKEGYTDFVVMGNSNAAAWNVVRSEFDNLLLEHASLHGVRVYDNTKVVSLEFEGGNKPVSAAYTHCLSSDTGDTVNGTIAFKYLVDATGRAGMMSTKYLKNRSFTESLKNIAVWGYWTGAGSYGTGTTRVGAPWFEALTDESGWAWFIPLHGGVTSVGVVVNNEIYTRRARSQPKNDVTHGKAEDILRTFGTHLGFSQKRQPQVLTSTSSTTQRYLETLELAPGLKKLLGDAKLIDYLGSDGDNGGSVHIASDYSYSADRYAGDGWRIIGDAGAFIDPFFSSGVHLALTGALSAAVSISASIRGDCNEEEAGGWHTERVAVGYTRFLVVVLGAYKQIKSQREDVLSDISEDNFDRAFKLLRPVIQGGSEMGRLSEDEVQQAMDFCGKLFGPTGPEEFRAVEKLLDGRFRSGATDSLDPEIAKLKFLDIRGPIIDPRIIEKVVRGAGHPASIQGLASDVGDTTADSQPNEGCEELDIQAVLDKVNARRLFTDGMHNFERESFGGWVARLEKGRLGLVRPVK